MAIAANSLSQGAVEQASAIEDLEGTVTNISNRVEESAKNAEFANKQANQIGIQIEESNQKMKKMIQAIEEINDSSNEIGKIIKTIEDIAFQTNILALNASVEAARAGAAGKGFAVVANEVRSLAEKSADASKSTTMLIERSVSAVKNGTKIANETAEQLSSVVSDTNNIINIVGIIANNSREEADSISQVQQQINQISSVVQTNSATAEESAATSQQLSEQSKVLKQLISVFRLNKK
jgi:methyl-accepting chemotaxis protein